jgi:AbrB family looped-hinge helix DNA binding protein
MNNPENMMNCDLEEMFYGTSTLGERGQLVIPAEARAALGMEAGDKILIMQHPGKNGLVLFKLSHARQFIEEFGRQIDRAEQSHTPEDVE